MEYIMLDIETFGTAPGSVILSISAVEFNRKGETGDEFHKDINIHSCVELGLKMDTATVLWWMSQSDEAREQFTDDRPRLSIFNAIDLFNQWLSIKKAGDFEKVFAKDPDFDCNIIEDACRKIGQPLPFKHREKVAIRTLSWLRPDFEKNEEFTGVKHNGIDDCKHQIKYVTKILQALSLDFKWEQPIKQKFVTWGLFWINDIIAKEEDIKTLVGDVPKDKMFIVKEGGLFNLDTDEEVLALTADQRFGKICSVVSQKE